MSDKHHHIEDEKEYLRYLKGQMSAAEQHAFEKRLLNDAFDQEALEGLSMIGDVDDAGGDIANLKQKIQARSASKFTIWKVAAGIILLAFFSFVIYYLLDFNRLNSIKISDNSGYTDSTPGRMKTSPTIIFPDSANETLASAGPAADSDLNQKNQSSANSISKTAGHMRNSENMTAIQPLHDQDSTSITVAHATPPQARGVELKGKSTANKLAKIHGEDDETMTIAEVPATQYETRGAFGHIANTKIVSGKVVSRDDNLGVPGVSIIVKETGDGTISDVNGNYSIKVPAEATLVYSSVGFESKEVKVGAKEEIDVGISPDVSSLSEVVVIGYGMEKNRSESLPSYRPPRPQGGNAAFRRYIRQNLKYPVSAIISQKKGAVKLKFTVLQDGSLTNMQVVKSLGTDFDEEALRLLQSGPSWIAAAIGDSTVTRDLTIRIKFKPPD